MNSDSVVFAIAPEIIDTAIVLVSVLLINFGISTIPRKRTRLSRETKLRASAFWRNFLLLVGVILLIFVWRAEIRAAALSVAALSVALVIAGKELLTSVFSCIFQQTARVTYWCATSVPARDFGSARAPRPAVPSTSLRSLLCGWRCPGCCGDPRVAVGPTDFPGGRSP